MLNLWTAFCYHTWYLALLVINLERYCTDCLASLVKKKTKSEASVIMVNNHGIFMAAIYCVSAYKFCIYDSMNKHHQPWFTFYVVGFGVVQLCTKVFHCRHILLC